MFCPVRSGLEQERPDHLAATAAAAQRVRVRRCGYHDGLVLLPLLLSLLLPPLLSLPLLLLSPAALGVIVPCPARSNESSSVTSTVTPGKGRCVRTPACGFMQSLTWAEGSRRARGRGLSAALAARRPDRGRGDYSRRPFARRAGHPGHAREAAHPLARPAAPPCIFAAIRLRGTADCVGRPTASSGMIEPRLAPPLPPCLRGFVRAPVDFDPFETNEVDLSGGMAGVLARMTSKGRYNVGLARRHGVEIEVTTDPASTARFYPACSSRRLTVRGSPQSRSAT